MIKINPNFENKYEYKIGECDEEIVNLAIIENFNKHNDINLLGLNFYSKKNKIYKDLLNQISKYTGAPEENILITYNGSGGGLDMILHAFTDNNTKVLVPVPNYPGFTHSVELSNATLVTIDNFKATKEDYKLFEEKIQNSGIVYISNPNLPLGYIVDFKWYSDMIYKYPNKLFIADEAYFEYGDNVSFATMYKCKNLFVTRTFSKAFALAGARIGYIIANESLLNIVKVCYNAKDLIESSILYARNVLINKKHYLNNVKKSISESKIIDKKLSKIIDKNKLIYDYYIPKYGPWYIIKTKHTKFVCDRFLSSGYLVRDKSKEIQDWVRISVSTKEHNDNVINIIKSINDWNYKTVLFDMDGTIRPDYILPVYKCVKDNWGILNKKYNVQIVTNNTLPKKKILKYLLNNNIEIENENLYCPINEMPLVDKNKNEDEDDSWFVKDNSVYLLNFPSNMHKVLVAIEKYKVVNVIENEYSTSSGEMGHYPDIMVPYIGYFLEYVKKNMPLVSINIIGKEEWVFKNLNSPVLMIGDTTIDERFAKNNNFDFVNVNDINIENCIKYLL